MDARNHQVAVSKGDLVGQFYAQRRAFIGYAYRFTANWDAAEDVFQEACLKFLGMPASFPSFPFAAKYLYKTLFCIAVTRQKKQSRLIYSKRVPEMVCEPEPEWQKQIMIDRLCKVTARLSPRERQLLDIHTLPGYGVREKSKMMLLPLSTYRYRVDRVISKLRKLLMEKSMVQMRTSSSQIGGN